MQMSHWSVGMVVRKLTYPNWTLDLHAQRLLATEGTGPSSFELDPHSGSTASRSCCRTWHLLGSWPTREKRSGAGHSCTTRLGLSLTTGDVRVHFEQFERLCQRAERDHAAVGSAGSASNDDPPSHWHSIRDGRR